MTLVKTGLGITDISGSFGGIYFHRDKSGLHACKKPRSIKRRSAAQVNQRAAFIKARRYSTEPRRVSYLIYRALNNLNLAIEAIVTGSPDPDCTGRYVLDGQNDGENLYRRVAGTWLLFYKVAYDRWYVANNTEFPTGALWLRDTTIEGKYEPFKVEYKPVWVTLNDPDTPADYRPDLL